MKNRIFLGGTCAETTWREELEKVLTVPSFNPVVDDWTPECQEEERLQKNNLCNIHLYVITSDMEGIIFCPPTKDRAKLRSKTYPGIAKAMAEQWVGKMDELC